MTRQTAALIFDVNETLSDLSTVADAFALVGAGPGAAQTWFATVLRDGFALTAARSTAVFAEIAENNARELLHGLDLTMSTENAVRTVLDAFGSVRLHPDVAPALQALHQAGHRLHTLSNGPTSTATRLLDAESVTQTMSSLLTVEGRSFWKPAFDSYRDALAEIPHGGSTYLVAVHPWDIHGASRAGLSTVWVNRRGGSYPSHFAPPDITVSTLEELPGRLA